MSTPNVQSIKRVVRKIPVVRGVGRRALRTYRVAGRQVRAVRAGVGAGIDVERARLYGRDVGGRSLLKATDRPKSGPFRCDLHPNPSPDGRKVVVTSLDDGGRQMYLLAR